MGLGMDGVNRPRFALGDARIGRGNVDTSRRSYKCGGASLRELGAGCAAPATAAAWFGLHLRPSRFPFRPARRDFPARAPLHGFEK